MRLKNPASARAVLGWAYIGWRFGSLGYLVVGLLAAAMAFGRWLTGLHRNLGARARAKYVAALRRGRRAK